MKICWRRDRLHIPVFLGFPCTSTGKESICNAGDLGLIPGLGRSPGKGNGYPLQNSGLATSMGSQRIRHDWAAFTFQTPQTRLHSPARPIFSFWRSSLFLVTASLKNTFLIIENSNARKKERTSPSHNFSYQCTRIWFHLNSQLQPSSCIIVKQIIQIILLHLKMFYVSNVPKR